MTSSKSKSQFGEEKKKQKKFHKLMAGMNFDVAFE